MGKQVTGDTKKPRRRLYEVSISAGAVRVELTSTVLETAVLPLNYAPKDLPYSYITIRLVCQRIFSGHKTFSI